MGLDIPMHNPAAVGMLQPLGDLHGKMQCLLPVENALDLHILLQGNTVNQLHDDIVGVVRRGNIVDLYDIGVAQHGHRFALRPETAAEFLIPGKFILQYFNGYQPVEPMAQRLIYNGHAPGADHFQDLIPVVQQPSDILVHKLKLLLSPR